MFIFFKGKFGRGLDDNVVFYDLFMYELIMNS